MNKKLGFLYIINKKRPYKDQAEIIENWRTIIKTFLCFECKVSYFLAVFVRQCFPLFSNLHFQCTVSHVFLSLPLILFVISLVTFTNLPAWIYSAFLK